jgi:hypothetical protein
MFTHKINNPNNLKIKNNNNTVIPFGMRCTSALVCKWAQLRKISLPFDWTIPTLPHKIKNVLENNFDEFIPNIPRTFFNKYDIGLAHFNTNIPEGIEQYKRRIERFNNIINSSDKKYFIYINEDFLYDKKFRVENFNQKMFQDMLELEIFIKEKYTNIDYTIIYFNFTEEKIPSNSNIFNIVINTSQYFESESDAPVTQFRIFCAKILAELFNTEFKCEFNGDDFNNL